VHRGAEDALHLVAGLRRPRSVPHLGTYGTVSIHVASIVWRTELGGPSIKAVAMKLADCAHDDGSRVHPGIRRVAREAEVSERTVQLAIKDLLLMKVLVLVRKGGSGPGDPNEYKFNLDVLWELRTKTERRWKEEDDRIKGENSAPLKRSRASGVANKQAANANSKGETDDGAKGAKSAPLDAKGENHDAKGENSANKGEPAAPNPSLPVSIDSSLKTRGARVNEFDFGSGKDGGRRHERRTLTVSKADGVLYRPTDEVLRDARSIARGWDFDGPEGLIAEFNELNDGTRLTDSDAAFLGFCRKSGAHPDMHVWVPTGQPLPKDLEAQSGEFPIVQSSSGWDRWLRYVETIDRPAADLMRGAFVVFAATPEPVSGSPIPRIPTSAAKRKTAA